ncbi:hypothetical protein BDP55DRAFT_688545 [Colletotrichum godetiae]|uniref:Uncharacterized protein n=1 Tax=Colletotrichum godetiae TaxID=1209918 RepID=A0AAJ0A5R1_9PEZI|nr:uncharacterized protein BDP55DRAFT_688620 [Colletotrichum godetiae]XP_060421358.1 uncharacterized protein BDP55DRAFT_688545 [Colletotrichum godetiae]KAK1656575.1 hypothetical protein BDP55DRAFT_688620 [Colletotrichum godetiae]KAK1656594.1 hypothetical protein BDP55DRAFT_688545 [Colletotrichum godetiae]
MRCIFMTRSGEEWGTRGSQSRKLLRGFSWRPPQGICITAAFTPDYPFDHCKAADLTCIKLADAVWRWSITSNLMETAKSCSNVSTVVASVNPDMLLNLHMCGSSSSLVVSAQRPCRLLLPIDATEGSGPVHYLPPSRQSGERSPLSVTFGMLTCKSEYGSHSSTSEDGQIGRSVYFDACEAYRIPCCFFNICCSSYLLHQLARLRVLQQHVPA